MNKIIKYFIYVLLFFTTYKTLFACEKTTYQRGYIIHSAQINCIIPSIHNKTDIKKIFGKAGIKNTFGKCKWTYNGYLIKKPNILNAKINNFFQVEITFDKKGKVKTIKQTLKKEYKKKINKIKYKEIFIKKQKSKETSFLTQIINYLKKKKLTISRR